jgi:hypothetical protein
MPSSYTFQQKPVPAGGTNFGGLVNDANHNALTGVTGNGIQTVDITGTPKTSPATIASNAVTTLLVPLNATQLTLCATTNTVNISEADATVASKYFTIPTGTVVTIPVARTSTLYLQANTGSATLSFFFEVV